MVRVGVGVLLLVLGVVGLIRAATAASTDPSAFAPRASGIVLFDVVLLGLGIALVVAGVLGRRRRRALLAISGAHRAPRAAAVSAAVVMFSGKGRSASPTRGWPSDDRTLEVVRDEVRRIIDDLNRLQPDWSPAGFDGDLGAASEWARAQMHQRHPQLSAPALDALEWMFSYQWFW